MDLITGALLLGAGWFGVKAFGGSKKSSAKTTGGGGVGPGCMDAAKDCTALIACANDALSKAIAADIPTLTKMMQKADLLGCSSLATEIFNKIAALGKDDVPSAGLFNVIHGVGLVQTAGEDDMLIMGLISPTGQKFVTPLIFSDGHAVYERALANIAIDKFKKTAGIDPAVFFGSAVVVGPPPDLKNGTIFNVVFSKPKEPADLFPTLGDVIAVVTAEQMKSSSFALTATTPATTTFAGENVAEVAADVAGEGMFDERPSLFGHNTFGRQDRTLGSAFGAKSAFGRTTVGG